MFRKVSPLAVIGTCLLLGACGTATEDVQSEASQVEPAYSDSGSETASEAAQDAPSAQLDLSPEARQQVLQEIDGGGQVVGDAPNQLPDMFDSPEEERRVRMSSKLLTKEEAATLQERVDGVEFKVEVRTD